MIIDIEWSRDVVQEIYTVPCVLDTIFIVLL